VRRRLAAAAGALAVAAACADPAAPARQAAYPFDDGFGAVFRWPASRLPVRVFADTRGPMSSLVAQGLAAWEAQFLYGEFRAALEPDSSRADVVVTWTGTVPPDVPPDPGPPVPACGGLTTLIVDATGAALERPIRVTVTDLGGQPTPGQLVACFARTVTHELGHALGLLQHSSDPADLMAAQPLTAAPTARDRRTVEVLYHTVPTIGPPPR
jgi:hypothetical protein